MLCSSCGTKISAKRLRLDLSKYRIQGDFERLDCTICNHFLAIKAGNDVISIDEAVEDGVKMDRWLEAKTRMDKIVYYALSQIIYPERDAPDADKHESMFDFADESDLVMLRWERGVPIGFYTLKIKGSKIFATNERYAMHTLDTAYIRSAYRSRGIGTEILINITQMFPDENVGFSRPISNGMWKVLGKFLTINKNHRLRFWEIEDAGSQGNRKLVWFTLKKRESSR